ncbi:hypothetical protein [Campylobacter troglodytis]|uniref:hypothetical protein n=1 Tax=Campylobacter troglodytis TaxID=654363 RepID=UPI00163C91A0|nr:hypothetical protein [Campylobacter troglodytis]
MREFFVNFAMNLTKYFQAFCSCNREQKGLQGRMGADKTMSSIRTKFVSISTPNGL